MSIIEISGRYPEVGFTVNKEVKELAYVIEGEGELIMDDKVIKVSKGDMIFLDKGEKFVWDGKLTLAMPCAPKWTPQQHEILDN